MCWRVNPFTINSFFRRWNCLSRQDMYCAVGTQNMMMTENSYVKMSARRNLSSLLGKPDHEQNKTDLAYWNNVFDQQFKARWGIDPKRDILDASVWQKITPDDDVPSAYGMSSLEWACNPKKRCRRTHLGLQGARAASPVIGKPLGEVNTNSVSPSTDRVDTSVTSSRPLTPILDVDTTEMVREQCESPKPTVTSTSPAESSTTTSSACQSSPQCSSSSSSSRKRKQPQINECFPQKKMCVTKRRIILH